MIFVFIVWSIIGLFIWRAYQKSKTAKKRRNTALMLLLCGPVCWFFVFSMVTLFFIAFVINHERACEAVRSQTAQLNKNMGKE